MPTVPAAAARVRATMAAGLVGMGTFHFVPAGTRGMAAMIPPRLRGRGLLSPVSLVRITGVCEIAGAIGLLNSRTRVAAGTALIVFFAAVFPANAYAAKDPERFGPVAIAFWPRLAAQVALAGLAAFAAFPFGRAPRR
ncbi:hypothetical protein [uncultured Amnibacterium sp.]|uniref:DoxX family protein n=1 Tax=uncultured Amnibacterium sp. TaxID=1631851 RepID=UPI0035CB95BD